jgi:hypothetical protein
MADEPFWPDLERLFGFQHLGALQVADLGGQALDRRGHDTQGREIGRVAVARDDLGRDWLDDQAHHLGHVLFNARIDIGEGADGARDRAGGDLELGHRQALLGALELGVVAGKLEAEGDRFGVDAVAAADADGHLVLERPALQSGQQQVDAFEQQVGGARQLHGEAGVQHVRAGHALVQEAGLGADDFRHVGQEGDDVVLGDALDLVDAVAVPDCVAALFPDRLGGQLGDDPKFGHGVGGVGLDLEPDLVLGLAGPDGGGFGAGVAADHGRGVSAGPPLESSRMAGTSRTKRRPPSRRRRRPSHWEETPWKGIACIA